MDICLRDISRICLFMQGPQKSCFPPLSLGDTFPRPPQRGPETAESTQHSVNSVFSHTGMQ